MFFDYINVHSLSLGGFFTFLIALAHGAPCLLLISSLEEKKKQSMSVSCGLMTASH